MLINAQRGGYPEGSMTTPRKVPLPNKIAISVSCHFSLDRLKYLDLISDYFHELGNEVVVFIITNTENKDEIDLITNVIKSKGFEFHFFIPKGLGHPYLLTWSHLHVFRELIRDETFTHFMYLEDDIKITGDNMLYYMEHIGTLKKNKLYPSFLRLEYFEKKGEAPTWYCSDLTKKLEISKLPKLIISNSYIFINLPEPYQGMYLMDRELMHEHLFNISSAPDFGIWNIREKAAQGLTFFSVPEGCYSRNFIGYNLELREIDSRCFIHHTPNNGANVTNHLGFGTIPVKDLIIFDI